MSLKTLQNVLDKTKQEKYILSFLLKVLFLISFRNGAKDQIFNLQSAGSWILWADKEDIINIISDNMDKKLKYKMIHEVEVEERISDTW